MTHFVYVYVSQGVMWEELYRSIQSLHKFYQGPKKIFVVGDKPRVNGVIHIPHSRVKGVLLPKAADSIAKLKLIANHKQINENFVYMYDDIIILKSCTEKDFRKTRAIDLVTSPGLYFKPGSDTSAKWRSLFMRTMTILNKHGRPMWNYETHLPRWFNKEKILEVIKKYDLEHLGKKQMLFASLYYNTLEDRPFETLKENENVKAGIYAPHEPKWLQRNIPGKLFLSYNNTGLNNNLIRFIKDWLK